MDRSGQVSGVHDPAVLDGGSEKHKQRGCTAANQLYPSSSRPSHTQPTYLSQLSDRGMTIMSVLNALYHQTVPRYRLNLSGSDSHQTDLPVRLFPSVSIWVFKTFTITDPRLSPSFNLSPFISYPFTPDMQHTRQHQPPSGLRGHEGTDSTHTHTGSLPGGTVHRCLVGQTFVHVYLC